MAPRIMEIVIYLVKELQAGVRIFDRLSEISPVLRNQGYTEAEIETAFSWVLEQGANVRRFRGPRKGGSIRVLSDSEREAFSASGYGFLIQMRGLGVINEQQMELVIQRAAAFHEAPWDSEMVKTMAAILLFEDKVDLPANMMPIIAMQISSDMLQ